MLIRSFPFLDPRRITSGITERLQALADDCARLEHDTTFVSAVLHTAPLLDHYAPVLDPLGVRLVGNVIGHPLLGSGRRIVTSQLWFADPQGHWIRTLSRFYRLGDPADVDPEPSGSAPETGRTDGNGWPDARH